MRCKAFPGPLLNKPATINKMLLLTKILSFPQLLKLCDICICVGNSIISSDIWHKYHE